MRVNIKLIDGTLLKNVFLTTNFNGDMRIGEVYLESEKQYNIMYFGGNYVQGGNQSS